MILKRRRCIAARRFNFDRSGSQTVSQPHSLPKRGIANVLCHTAAKQVLNGTISDKGILAPMNSKINDPLMKELKEKYG